MAKNIFDVTNDDNNQINRSEFDWTHANSFSLRLGYAYPIFSKLMPPNSTLKMQADLALQFMPMVFPIQTPMKARVSFYRVPLRTLWKDYKDYIGNFRIGLEEPYHDFSSAPLFEGMMGVGKLGDFLDIPIVSYGDFGAALETSFSAGEDEWDPYMCLVSDGAGGFYNELLTDQTEMTSNSLLAQVAEWPPAELAAGYPLRKSKAFYYRYSLNYDSDNTFSKPLKFNEVLSTLPSFSLASDASVDSVRLYFVLTDSDDRVVRSVDFGNFVNISGSWVLNDIPSSVELSFDGLSSSSAYMYNFILAFNEQSLVDPSKFNLVANESITTLQGGNFVFSVPGYTDGYVEITRESSPYYDSNLHSDGLKLAAYKARAYEAIYNSYYRDNRNNPYYVNGEVQYNTWIPTDAGGADTTVYQLHRVNWEKDFLTTAVPSPQQGKAPLVGLTTYATTEDGKTYLKLSLVDDDGKRYAVSFDSDASGVHGVDYSELPDATSVSPLSFRSLIDSASSGISIPDLRAVNAYQKFLELNMRKGYSYKDIVQGRFDVEVRYDDLNIPEFLGGFTRNIQMNRVVQSVERGDGTGQYADALGSLAGDAFLSSSDNPVISCFCDEESIVMGIISIVPIPVYTQLLPKDFLYRDVLDHFTPEFNALGFQPITYAEVCPIQAKLAGQKLDGTFGYQRPWYEYVQQVDTAHGLMRTQLRNFLMNRTFDAVPRLSESFLLVDDTQLNDVFAVTETTDKVTGQILFRATATLPVARVAIPRLD